MIVSMTKTPSHWESLLLHHAGKITGYGTGLVVALSIWL